MKVWLVRGGKHGQQESLALEKSLACIGFDTLPNLINAVTKESMQQLVAAAYPDARKGRVNNWASQVYAFAHRMREGDIVAMPLKTQPQVALGIVRGPYEYRDDLRDNHHTRSVHWIHPNLSRTQFKQDLLYSLGALMTVCQIQRNNALTRFQAILAGKHDPGYEPNESDDTDNPLEPRDELSDIEQIARDQIRAYVGTQFKGHDLSRLVEAILRAEGYVTLNSPPGADGGVDILARRGTLGFEGPKLCVQVKSSVTPADVVILRGLQGSMTTFKAEEGLLVCWGGFNRAVQREARLSFFSVRLWDADDLLAALERNYDRIPEEIKNELSLKRIWALVPQE